MNIFPVVIIVPTEKKAIRRSSVHCVVCVGITPFDHYNNCRTVNTRASCAGGREFVSQRPAKSYTALQTVRHRFNIYAGSYVALAL